MMMQEASNAKAADHQTIMSQCSRSERKSAMKPPDQVLKCPRCDSPNTKFCYYNNYSLTQPRHFCKTCRRYWTKGGALRNVPIGGGCRKNKRPKQQQMAAAVADQPRLRHIVDAAAASGCLNNDIENGGGLSLLQSALSTPMSFPDRLGLSFSRGLQDSMSAAGEQPVFGFDNTTPPATTTTSILQSSCQALANLPPLETTLLGLNLPATKPESVGFDITAAAADLNSLFETSPPTPQISQPPRASTSFNLLPMESLNNLNADLQWRLQQQQRLAMILAAADKSEANKENSAFRLDIKPAAKPCTLSYYPAAILNGRLPTCTMSESWNPMSDNGHVEGLYQSGYWNPTAWTSDLQQYISNNSAGALP